MEVITSKKHYNGTFIINTVLYLKNNKYTLSLKLQYKGECNIAHLSIIHLSSLEKWAATYKCVIQNSQSYYNYYTRELLNLILILTLVIYILRGEFLRLIIFILFIWVAFKIVLLVFVEGHLMAQLLPGFLTQNDL